MVICHEKGLRENLEVKANLLCWRSGRIQRVVNSTLAAETQALSRGFGDLLWVMVPVRRTEGRELSDPQLARAFVQQRRGGNGLSIFE